MASEQGLFPEPGHDHGRCISAGFERAEAACAGRRAKFTPNRRAVLEILLSDHKPLSAYEIAERIDWKGRKGGPVQVYRALELFEALGLVHRIESLNAYIACSRLEATHGAQFLVCKDCNRVAETSDHRLERDIRRLAAQAGFVVHLPVVEIKGLCADCADGAHG
jgi:Fur family zinc uptake transcriptional regulator